MILIETGEDLKYIKEKFKIGTKFKLISGSYMQLVPHILYEVIDTPPCLNDSNLPCNNVHCNSIGRKVVIKSVNYGKVFSYCFVNNYFTPFTVEILNSGLGLFIREEDYLV